MKGDVKKFKVYVRNEKGNVIKVNFGDPNMEIKRDDPERRKSFRARHKCADAKDRTTPKYWSCKMWSKTPVSKIVGEDFVESEKNSIFDDKYIRMKLKETFGQDAEPMTAPTINPKVEPMTEPNTKPSPSRKNKPFLPMPNVQPRPKAIAEGKPNYEVYHNTFSSAVQTAKAYAEAKGYTINDDEWFNRVSNGPKKPSEGVTNRYSLGLYVGDKEQRKMLHIQVYGMNNKYELNAYIS